MDSDSLRCVNKGLEALSGAHNSSVNDMRLTHAHNLHKHKYVIYDSSGQLLELFRLLSPIKGASHKRNRQLSPPDSHCLQGTREPVFDEVRSWVNDHAAQKPSSLAGDDGESEEKATVKHICWLYGFVGCGKSAIAQNIAEEYARKNRLAVSFFFFRNAGDRSTIDRFAASIAHQISLNVPGAKKLIEQAIIDDPSLIEPTCSLEFQLEHLVFGPLVSALKKSGTFVDDPFLLVIDGLDECNDKEGISAFIDNCIEFFYRHPDIPLRLLITSRIEEHIQTHIEDGISSIYLIDLVSRSSRADVMSFMAATFEKARKHDRALRALGDVWPEPQDLDQLVDYCDGSFIFASTIARFILGGSGRRDSRTPMERLPLALKINPGLDGVYAEVLSRAQHLPHFQLIISTVASVQTPISIKAMSTLLGLSTYEVIRILVLLQAILQVPGRDDVPVSLFHTSLREFLVPFRSGSFHSQPSHHTYLMYRCLDLLFGKNPATHDECCRYAMVYWPLHLHIAARTDPSFDRDSVTKSPYHTLHVGDCLASGFEAIWAKRRPLTFVLSEAEWYAMSANAKRADIVIHSSKEPDDVDSTREMYCLRQADKSQWALVRTEGYSLLQQGSPNSLNFLLSLVLVYRFNYACAFFGPPFPASEREHAVGVRQRASGVIPDPYPRLKSLSNELNPVLIALALIDTMLSMGGIYETLAKCHAEARSAGRPGPGALYGQSCPPIVKVDSSRPCSIGDIVQGLSTLMSSLNRISWSLYFSIRVSKDLAINLDSSGQNR